jgi:hypothetical protein
MARCPCLPSFYLFREISLRGGRSRMRGDYLVGSGESERNCRQPFWMPGARSVPSPALEPIANVIGQRSLS